MSRRTFLQAAAAGVLGAASFQPHSIAGEAPPLRAAIIGHTGRGSYGHDLDLVFAGRRGIQVVAIADPDEGGRAAALRRTGAARGYADYRAMLEQERPHLVCVAPRWTDQHHAMVAAALRVGAHVYCEKPFTQTLAEADDLIAQATAANLKLAVAHQGRLAPATLLLKRQLEAGLIGELLEIRVHGKQDRRAGGEDMLVLGTHQFDLVRLFTGDAQWCTARVLQDDREITRSDGRHAARENIGLIAGNNIEALFAMAGGVNVHYSSRTGGAAAKGPWGMELIGTKGRARLLNDPFTDALVWLGGEISPQGQKGEWVPLSTGADSDRSVPAANRRVVDDWLEAIRNGREPICSGHAAMKSLEMIHAVFAAGVSRERVGLPMRNRAHPLGERVPFQPAPPPSSGNRP